MQLRQISIKEVSPYVRFVQRYTVPNTLRNRGKFLNAYDHRLFYVRMGHMEVEFTDRTFELTRGDLIVWPAGWPYRVISLNEDDPLILLGCNFDYTMEHFDYSYPIPPDFLEEFHPERVFENIRIVECPATDGPIYLHNMQSVESELEEMLHEYRNQLNFTDNKLSGMLLKILCSAFRQNLAISRSGELTSGKVDEIIEYIHLHYAEELSNESIAQVFKYHPNYISKQMVQATGKSLHQYLISYRISRAVELLTTTSIPVSIIATEVGFNDIPHFTRLFRQRTGLAPNDYRHK